MKSIVINARSLTCPVTGIQRYTREMIAALYNLGKDRYRFILAVPRKVANDLCADVEVIDDHSRLPGYLWEQVRLPTIIKKTKADLLWSPSSSGPLFVRKQLVTIHDASVFACRKCFRWMYGIYHRTLLPLLSKRVLRVITVSEFSKSELISYNVCRPERISVIHNGIRLGVFGPRKRENRPDTDRYVLSVGSHDPRKNNSRLLEAWQTIAPEIKQETKLVITGGDGSRYSEEIFRNLPDDVVLSGYVTEDALASLYSHAKFFIYPSIYEGFGFPPLEAMASGTPALVSNVASLPEVCGDAVLYCNPFDAASIAQGITRLLADESLRAQLQKKGLDRVKEFTWQKAADHLIQIFDEELSRNT